jgi:hypothetical protein
VEVRLSKDRLANNKNVDKNLVLSSKAGAIVKMKDDYLDSALGPILCCTHFIPET